MLCSNLKTSFRPLVINPVLDGAIAVDRKGLELFEVHVNRMLPSARVVLEDPLLHACFV